MNYTFYICDLTIARLHLKAYHWLSPPLFHNDDRHEDPPRIQNEKLEGGVLMKKRDSATVSLSFKEQEGDQNWIMGKSHWVADGLDKYEGRGMEENRR